MKNVIEAGDLPEEENVYLKKDWLGYRVVEPIKDPVTGKINWMSLLFGGKRGLLMLVVVLVIAVLLYIGITQLVSNYQMIAAEPCKYCIDCALSGWDKINNIQLR